MVQDGKDFGLRMPKTKVSYKLSLFTKFYGYLIISINTIILRTIFPINTYRYQKSCSHLFLFRRKNGEIKMTKNKQTEANKRW